MKSAPQHNIYIKFKRRGRRGHKAIYIYPSEGKKKKKRERGREKEGWWVLKSSCSWSLVHS
jgi:hypothetical protein